MLRPETLSTARETGGGRDRPSTYGHPEGANVIRATEGGHEARFPPAAQLVANTRPRDA